MLECVINISEGRRVDVVESIAGRAGRELLDVHRDPDHNRSVLTVVGEAAARDITTAAVEALDLGPHEGAHPRIGVVDVVPFVPLGSTTFDAAVEARDRFTEWAADELAVPCFRYGRERTLPEVRRRAFVDLAPDTGPDRAHPTAGAIAVGARPVLVAYNLWLVDPDLEMARAIAHDLRSESVRALGLAVGAHVQVSMNLVDPYEVGPADVYKKVADVTPISRAELVGLVPLTVLELVGRDDWSRLDLALDRTIEARLEAKGLSVD
jgi:glutamate formiminotransferase/glutamate formiminotransferase/formiminotetrahydrofolate cyclodeaminase